jgi:hypothetical protein
MPDAAVLRASFVLAVPDAMTTARWWMESMKFELLQDYGGWVFVSRGACTVMLGSCTDIIPVPDLGDHQYFGYIEVDDIDAYRATIDLAAGSFSEPEDRLWGMREMDVRTPDGHRLKVGQRLS